MNRIKRKIASSAGASMLLAVVFMLFCVLVGGTVLAASAANGYRMNRMSDSQVYLNQRSAAMLIASELRTADDTQLRVTITNISRTVQPVKIERDGKVTNSGSATTVHTVAIQFPKGLEMTAVQRVMMETAVWQYLKDAGITDTDDVSLINFCYVDDGEVKTVTDMDQFWYQYKLNSNEAFDGSLDISGEYAGQTFVSQEVFFAGGEGEDLYDFSFGFGENSHINVNVDASFSEKTPMNSSYVVAYEDSDTGYARVSTVSTQTAIIWGAPIVEKGGD